MLRVDVIHKRSLLYTILLRKYHNLFVNSTVGLYLGNSLVLNITNSASMNISLYMGFEEHTYTFLLNIYLGVDLLVIGYAYFQLYYTAKEFSNLYFH